MLTGEALDIVLSMARELRETCKVQREDVEMEAIEEVELLLRSFDDDFWDKHDTTSENGGC
jgi:hypothetical protein